MTRHRLLSAAVAGTVVLLAAGCAGGGGDDAAGDAAPAATAPAAVALPVAVAPATLGGPVRAGADTPKDVVAALGGDDVVVVAFLNAKAADDQKVAAAVRAARADAVVSDGARYFVYTLGGRDFGDLADVLGVEGTPAVAVIGRDRNLANLFIGLIDGDILRQAVWDAADTAAKNVGTSAPAPAAPRRPSGNPAGIALARKVNAAYADVPGVRFDATLTEAGKTATVTGSSVLEDGEEVASHAVVTIGGRRIDLVSPDGSATYGRPEGQACWKARPDDDADENGPAIELDARFGKPVARGDVILLRATGEDSRGVVKTSVYTIDAATMQVRSVRAKGLVGTFAALTAAPEIPDPTPVCGGAVR